MFATAHARVRPRLFATALFAGFISAIGACEAGDDAMLPAGGADVVRRDSAGIAIVEASARVLEALPIRRLQAAPALLIGRMDGPEEELLGSVSDATLLTEELVAIADAQAKRIVVFDTTGSFRFAIGGEGEGPGEFRSLQRIAVIDDTLYVPDPNLGRLQRFNVSGQYIDGRRVTGSIGLQSGLQVFRPGRFTSPHAYRITPNGFPRDVDEGDGPHPTAWVVGRGDSTGGVRFDTLAAADAWYVDLSTDEVRAARAAGLEHFSVGNVLPHPAAPDARVTFLIDRPVIGWTGRPELWLYGQGYTHAAIIRLDLPEPDHSLDDERSREWTIQFDQRNDRPIARRAWNVLPHPDVVARFHALRSGRHGSLWIAIGPVRGADTGAPYWTRWLRVNRDGEPVEWIVAPPGDILELGSDVFLFLDTDELGVHRVAVHRYER